VRGGGGGEHLAVVSGIDAAIGFAGCVEDGRVKETLHEILKLMFWYAFRVLPRLVSP